MASRNFDVVMIGHVTKDKNVVDGEKRESFGGAVYYGALAIRRIGVNVAVITKLAREDFSKLSIFKKAGITVFARETSRTTEMKNVYSKDDPDKRQCYPLRFADSFTDEDFPDIHAKIVHIGALVRGEVPLKMIEKLSQKIEISLDVQGFVRVKQDNRLVLQDWKEKKRVLPHIKYLKADKIEAQTLTGSSDLPKAAKILAEEGPSEVLITHKKGALLFAGGKLRQAPFRPRLLRGRTGRGDTCISAYIGKRLTTPPYRSLCFAAALTTLKLEKEGPFGEGLEKVEALSKKFEMRKY